MKLKDYLWIVLLIAADQFSKFYISTTMALYQSIEVIKDFFSITYVRNDGAAFSMLTGQRWFFVVAAAAACIYICIYASRNKTTVSEKIALILIVAGAIGNAIDRLVYGTVVDFLDFLIFGYDFPVFNVADICITIGVGLLILCIFFEGKGKKA